MIERCTGMANCAPNGYKGMKKVPPVQGGVPEELAAGGKRKTPRAEGTTGEKNSVKQVCRGVNVSQSRGSAR